MIRFENRFDANAYRVSTLPVDNACPRVEEGQWVTIKGGKLTLAAGTEKKAFLAMGSKREGRDQVSGRVANRITILVGPFALITDQFDKSGSYDADMTALKIKEGGILTPITADTDKIAAYAVGQPVNGFLRIIKE